MTRMSASTPALMYTVPPPSRGRRYNGAEGSPRFLLVNPEGLVRRLHVRVVLEVVRQLTTRGAAAEVYPQLLGEPGVGAALDQA